MPGVWHPAQVALGRPAWSAGAGTRPPAGAWHAMQLLRPVMLCGVFGALPGTVTWRTGLWQPAQFPSLTANPECDWGTEPRIPLE